MMNEESDLIVWLTEQLDREEAQAQYEADMSTDCGWRPSRVLEEIAAKKQILATHQHYIASSAGEVGCGICALNPRENVIEPEGWCATVRWLAAPLNANAGYRRTWAPKRNGGRSQMQMGSCLTEMTWRGRRV